MLDFRRERRTGMSTLLRSADILVGGMVLAHRLAIETNKSVPPTAGSATNLDGCNS